MTSPVPCTVHIKTSVLCDDLTEAVEVVTEARNPVPSTTPGLVLTQIETSCPRCGGDHLRVPLGARFGVVHARSGLLVASSDDPEGAAYIADGLAAVADWTASGHELRATVDARAMQDVIDARGNTLVSGLLGDPGDVSGP